MPSAPVTAAPAQPAFTPEQIGQRAKQAAASRYTQGLGTLARLHQFETLRSLLQHIRNIPLDACPDLRVKGNDLVAKLGSGQHQVLIGGFRSAPDEYGAVDALRALNVSRQTHGSRGERFFCALSWVGNRLRGNTGDQARSEHLPLDRGALVTRINQRLDYLMTYRPGHNGIAPHGDPEFFRGKNATFLEGRDLAGMPLHECKLRDADFRDKDLSGCSLPNDLTGVDLRGATLFGLSFGKQSPFHRQLSTDRAPTYALARRSRTYKAFATKEGLTYPDFTGVILKDAKLSMADATVGLPGAKSNQRASALDLRFNHINNTSTGSILKTIHSIEDNALKQALMAECLEGLMSQCSPSDRASIAQPLADILFNRAYLHPGSVQTAAACTRAVIDELIAANFDAGDSRLLDLARFPHMDLIVFLGAHVDHALKLIHASPPTGLSDAHAAYCQQLVQACSREEDAELRDRALGLQKSLFHLPANAESVEAMSQVLGYDDSDAVELGGVAVFHCGDDRSVVMTGEYYRAFVQGDVAANGMAPNPEYGIELYDRGQRVDTSALVDHLNRNVFLRGFLAPSLRRHDPPYLRGLQLEARYRTLFGKASLTSVHRGEKLVSSEHKQRLADAFAPCLLDQSLPSGRHVTVTDAYVNDVMARNEVAGHTRPERGYFLLCLAAIFTRYSSSSHFGTETDSPDALRAFAAGLLTRSRDYLGETAAGELADFQDRLLGNAGAFACSAIAFNKMNTMLRGMADGRLILAGIYETTMPPNWR